MAAKKKLTRQKANKKVVAQTRVYTAAEALRAKILYLTGDFTYEVVADKLKINVHTVRKWGKEERWYLLRRDVRQVAAADAVRLSRKTMAQYFNAINSKFQFIANRMTERLEATGDDALAPIRTEKDAMYMLMEAATKQLALARIAATSAMGREMTPDPAYMDLSPVEERAVMTTGELWVGSVADVLAEELAKTSSIIKEAIKFVVEVDDLDLLFEGVPTEAVSAVVIDEEEDTLEDNNLSPAEMI